MPPVRRPEAEEYDVESASAALGAPAYRPLSGIPEDVRAFVMRGASEGTSTRRDPLADAQERGALLDFMARQGAGFDNIGRELVGLGRRGVDSPRGQPVAELQQRQAAAEREAMRDPESPQAARLRALLGQTGAGLSPEVLAQLTAEDGSEAMQVAGMRLQGKAREDAAVAAERKRAEDAARRQAEQAADDARRKAKQEHDDEQREKDRRAQKEAAAITAGDKATQQRLETETGLRKELTSNPVVKEYQNAAIAFDKVQKAAEDPSASGDLALIFAFMKTLDPGSVVKQDEFANAQNATNVPERVRNTWNKALTGERLSPDQRAEFIGTAYSQFLAAKKRADSIIDGFDGLARQVGVAPERVVLPGTRIDVDLTKPLPKATTPTPAKGPQQLADVPVLKLSPGQKAVDVIPEGEMRRVNMGGGKVRLVVKRNGKLKVVE